MRKKKKEEIEVVEEAELKEEVAAEETAPEEVTEEVETEEISSDDAERKRGNPILNYFRLLIRDIVVHIKEKPGTIFGLLALIPGILIGATINTFISAAHGLNSNAGTLAKMGGFLIFVIEVSGVLNIVNGFGIMTSRRLKTSILATIVAAIISLCGALWIIIATSYMLPNNKDYIAAANTSVIIIIICMATAVVGAIGSFFFYDHNYKKENR